MSKQKYAPTAAERALYGPWWDRKDPADKMSASWKEAAIAGLLTAAYAMPVMLWPC